METLFILQKLFLRYLNWRIDRWNRNRKNIVAQRGIEATLGVKLGSSRSNQ